MGRLFRSKLFGFVLLPAVVIAAVGVAAGPLLWHIAYPPAREFCMAQFGTLTPGKIFRSVMLLLTAVSIGAVLVAFVKELVVLTRLHRTTGRCRAAIPKELDRLRERHRLPTPLVFTAEDEPYAFSLGFLRPVIVVSSGLVRTLTTVELEAVLLHEAAHAANRDPLKIFLARTLAKAFFYIPIVKGIRDRYLLRLEISADRLAVNVLKVQPLASALAKLLQAPTEKNAAWVTASMVNATQERIRYLMDPERPLPPRLFFSKADLVPSGLLVFGSLLLAAGATGAINKLAGSGTFCNLRI